MKLSELTEAKLANLFDHTCLKACAVKADFDQLCREAKENGFKMVAINSSPVAYCKSLLKDTPVHVGAAIGFPLGQTTIETKCFETQDAIRHGADEIDYVINIGELKNGNYDYIEEEMRRICEICREAGVLSKVIFENCYLEKDEIRKAAEIAQKVKPDFVKTSTGFGTGGATAEDVRLMKEVVGEEIKVKAAGGIRDWETCRQMIEAGAERIGTSSSFKILEGYREALKTGY
ncbi:deoxyribose-phosphate aldolase [Lacrimispora sp.]|jgi:deoxyribose-phosphate aldolase|uniref:deoxyribose-phosphate aldolase n=1 Tax=Lacrimispora sp. TaxID=2719234 RepID=UPI0028999DF4|nr:deoxyribose-phosphate aldolase [Lacrimispora sp.]